MSINTAHNRGFTLVELLLVITIIVIMSGAMIPSFTSYLRNQNLRQAHELLLSDIRTVQNKALTGALSDQTVASGPVTHWGIRLNNGSADYYFFVASGSTAGQLNAECVNYAAAQGTGSVVRNQGKSTFLSGIVYRSTSGCLFFDLKNGTTRTSFLTSPMYIGYAGASASGSCRQLRFNNSGLVYKNSEVTCP